jgi:autotransporter-associated beta strand protein
MNTLKTFTSSALLLILLTLSGQAASSTWSAGAGGDWGTSGNWNAGTPGAVGLTNNADRATFTNTNSGTFAITNDTTRSLGTIAFGSTNEALVGNFTLSGSALRLNGGTGNAIQVLGGSFVNTGSVAINNDILLNTAGTFSTASPITNTPAAGTLTLGGAISLEASRTNNTRLTITPGIPSGGTNSALIIVNGQISNGGSNGALLDIAKSGSGLLRITSSNTYGGGTRLEGGIAVVGSDAALGTGQITFTSGALASDGLTARSLTNTWTTGTNNGPTFGSATSANNITATNTAGITLTGNGTLVRSSASNAVISAFTAVTLAGNTSEAGGFAVGFQFDGQAVNGSTLTLSGTNSFSGQFRISRGVAEVNNLAAVGSNSSIGTGSANSTVSLGASGPAILRYIGSNNATLDRQINLDGNVSMAVESSGAGTLAITGNVTTGGSRTFTFGGTNTGNNEVTSSLTNNGTNTLTIVKSGSGKWVLSGSNSYTSSTSINDGTLSVSSINSVVGGASFSSLGAPTDATTGRIVLGASNTTGTLVYTGSGETTDRAINLTGTTGGGVIDQSGSGLLRFTANFTTPGAGSKILTLRGSTAGTGEISGVIRDQSTVSNNLTAVTKAGTGKWTLSGLNTYTGNTRVEGGILLSTRNTNLATTTAILVTNAGSTLAVGYGGAAATNYTEAQVVTLLGKTTFASTDTALGFDTTQANGTYSNNLTIAAGVTKLGANTLTLAGTNTYTGDTTVNEGTLALPTTGSIRFVIGGNGTNSGLKGTGTTVIDGQFAFDLAAASTNNGDSWTIVEGSLTNSYGTNFLVTGFNGVVGGNWTNTTNGVDYIFAQPTGILTVVSTGGVTPYNAWVAYWQGIDPNFTNTAGTANPDGDPFDNNEEFAFDGNPTIGTGALLTAAKVGTNVVFSYVAMTNTNAVTYAVQSTPNLSVGPWTNNTSVTISNSANQSGISQTNNYVRKEFVVPASNKDFYRVNAFIAP